MSWTNSWELETMVRQRTRDLTVEERNRMLALEGSERPRSPASPRRRLAALLVRAGLLLDPRVLAVADPGA
jgi:hypothetical protein